MTDEKCKVMGCHEGLKLCLTKKVSKKFLLILEVPLFTLLGIGVAVWSSQESDPLRYAKKGEMAKHSERVTEMQVIVQYLQGDISEIKKSQGQTEGDIKEILRHLRK